MLATLIQLAQMKSTVSASNTGRKAGARAESKEPSPSAADLAGWIEGYLRILWQSARAAGGLSLLVYWDNGATTPSREAVQAAGHDVDSTPLHGASGAAGGHRLNHADEFRASELGRQQDARIAYWNPVGEA